VTVQVGEEHLNDTIRDMERWTLPQLRKYKVRFVELARRGHLQEEGIVILQDTREPVKLNPAGHYRLSDELLSAGTVPQVGGEHRCALKFKAFVVETWLAWEFRNVNDVPVYHVFGYNAEEPTRIEKSSGHIADHNRERHVALPPSDRVPFMVFGFNAEEIGRIDRSRKYDGPSRIGYYPLQDWAWGRLQCENYIFEQTTIIWKKSACPFCPFNKEAANCTAAAAKRFNEHPEQTAHGLLVEYNSLCFNPRGHLYATGALLDVIDHHRVEKVQAAFEKRLAEIKEWGLYKVRRIYTAKGKAMRCVELLSSGPRAAVLADFGRAGNDSVNELVVKRGIQYAYFDQRMPPEMISATGKRGQKLKAKPVDRYPDTEGFFVVAPAFMKTKLRGKIEVFDARYRQALLRKEAVLEAVA
jgi:hypothetical protein